MSVCEQTAALKNKGEGQVIAVTGGIGSGKSRVCSYLAGLSGFPVVDLDKICRQLLSPGADGWLALKKRYGDHFFSPSGELDRAAFRRALFADEQLRSTVDKLLHPLARKRMICQVVRIRESVLVEIPLLFEAGWQDDADHIVVVYAQPAVRVRRIINRDHIDCREALREINAQQSLLDKALRADHVVDNSASWQDTCLQLRHLFACLA